MLRPKIGIGQADQVSGGKLESADEESSAFVVEMAGSQGSDDKGCGDLDRFAVFEDWQDERAGRVRGFGGPYGAVTEVQPGVKVTPELIVDTGGVATLSVGLDVTAEFVGLECPA